MRKWLLCGPWRLTRLFECNGFKMQLVSLCCSLFCRFKIHCLHRQRHNKPKSSPLCASPVRARSIQIWASFQVSNVYYHASCVISISGPVVEFVVCLKLYTINHQLHWRCSFHSEAKRIQVLARKIRFLFCRLRAAWVGSLLAFQALASRILLLALQRLA